MTDLSCGGHSRPQHQAGVETAEPPQIASRFASPAGRFKGEGAGESFANGMLCVQPTTGDTRIPGTRMVIVVDNLSWCKCRSGGRGKECPRTPSPETQFSGPRLLGVSWMKVSCKEPPEVILAGESLCFPYGRSGVGAGWGEKGRRSHRTGGEGSSGEPEPREAQKSRHTKLLCCASELYRKVPQTTTGLGWASENRRLQQDSLVPLPRSRPCRFH